MALRAYSTGGARQFSSLVVDSTHVVYLEGVIVLETDFQFSQGSLQDYVDCPRRFQLRYVEQVAWPAPEAEPALENERHMRLGTAFHRLVHQHRLGIPAELLARTIDDEDLQRWWASYLQHGPTGLPSPADPEVTLSAPLSGYRLLAKLDLLAIDPGRQALVVDWKTLRRRPHRQELAASLQTRVYLYLLMRAGAQWNGGQPFLPEQVEMLYWFANYPHEPERLVYTAARYQADHEYLSTLIQEIAALSDDEFPLTADLRFCRYCPYRSLCQRGVVAGPLEEFEQESAALGRDISLDLEQIAEVEY